MSQLSRKKRRSANDRVNENDHNQSQGNLLYEHPRSQSLPNTYLENLVTNTQPDANRRFSCINNPSTPKRTGFVRLNSDRKILKAALDLDRVDTTPRRRTRYQALPTVLSNTANYGQSTDEIPAKIFRTSNQNPQASVPSVGTAVSSTTCESIGSANGAGSATPSSPYKPISKINRLQRRKRKRFSPDITEVTKWEPEGKDNDSSSSSNQVSEAETVLAEGSATEGSSTSPPRKNMTDDYDFLSKRGSSSISDGVNAERIATPQTNRRNHNLNYDKFTLKGLFQWLETQINNSTPKSNILKLLTAVLKRREVFLILQHDLDGIKSNPYLMERKSLDDLFAQLLRNLRNLVEGEMNTMISDYQAVLGILTREV